MSPEAAALGALIINNAKHPAVFFEQKQNPCHLTCGQKNHAKGGQEGYWLTWAGDATKANDVPNSLGNPNKSIEKCLSP